MKNLIPYLILFLIIIFSSRLQAQTNRALIVAISDYPLESGWEEIHAVNDCKLIVPMLRANGYKDSNITLLLNNKATKSHIIKELKKLGKNSRAGDYIYIQFSGHGQQMIDDNGDEIDGLDEAFIPYDACFRYTPGKYEGENHLRDDELDDLLKIIRRRIGEKGNITVVLDACHSGTGNRDNNEDEYVRGTAYIFAPPGINITRQKQEQLSLRIDKENGLSPVSVFSACLSDELNYEYKTGSPATYYGFLSYYFCELMNKKNNSLSNYSFFIRLKEKMSQSSGKKNRKQTPYFEGTDYERLFVIGNSIGNDKKTK